MIRPCRQSMGGEVAGKPEAISIKDIVIDKEQMSVFRNGAELDLTNTEYGILLLLSENRGRVYSLQQIYEEVWQDTFLASSGNTVMVHIRNLREKLKSGKNTENLIRNKWGRGYYID